MNYFLNNPVSSLMAVCGIALFGIIAVVRLPVGLLPQVEYPAVSIIVEYPGISPEKIEHNITRPVERVIRTVPGIECIESSSEEGKSRITITLHPDIDAKIAALKIREQISLIRDSFPRAVQEPVVLRYDPSDRPALIAAVVKIPKEDATPTDMREYAEQTIKPRLQRIDGVSEIYVAGGLQKEIHVTVDSGKFFARCLDFNEIINALQRESVSMPAGSIQLGNAEYRIRIPERFRSTEDMNSIVLRAFEGRFLYLSDIADVEESSREPESLARHNGEERVLIYLHKASDANTLSVLSQAREIFASLSGCEIETIYSQADYIRKAVGNAVSSGLWGLLIVVFIIALFYRDILKACAIALSIPLSLFAVFSLMYFARLEINIITLCGLALASGMVVDTGILVIESISHARSMERIASAISRIRIAATASTLTTVAVFFPLIFAEETVRRTYFGMAFTVSAACVVSLAVSTALVPSLYLAAAKHNFFHAMVLPLPSIFGRFTERASAIFRDGLAYASTHGKKIYAITASFIACGALSLVGIRTEFTDPFAAEEFHLFCEFPTGTPLRVCDEATRRIEARIAQLSLAEKISSKVEKWRGTISVTLKQSRFWETNRSDARQAIAQEAQRILQPLGGFAFVSEAAEAADRELDIIFTGKDDAVLRSIARDAAHQIGTLSGIAECVLRFREGKPSYRLIVDREKSGAFGIASDRLAHFFHGALFGPVALKHHTGEREVDVRVKFDRTKGGGISNLLSGSLPLGSERSVPLSQLVRIEEGSEATRLTRYNGRRAVRITARFGSISPDTAAQRIREKLAALSLPEDYGWEFDTAYEKSRKNVRLMALLVFVAFLIVYMVMAAILESLRLPLLIIATVPIGICGVIIAFFLSGSTLNSSAFMGLIVLAGIAVNNGIVIVEQVSFHVRTSKRRLTPENISALAQHVSLAHFRPLLSTTLTTIGGFIPALVSFGEGSSLWRPLALAVVSGLAVSSLASGILIPIIIHKFFYTPWRNT